MKAFRTVPAVCIGLVVAAVLSGCVSTPERAGTSLAMSAEAAAALAEKTEVERLIALGSPSSLEEVVRRLGDASILPPADAVSYGWIAYEMARLVYPEMAGDLPPSMQAPPDTPLVMAFLDARNGKVATPSTTAGMLFELFPALSVFRLRTAAANQAALTAMERFDRFGVPSAAGDLARGTSLERAGDTEGALLAYTRAERNAPDCYPSTLGKARMLVAGNKGQEALVALASVPSGILESPVGRRIVAEAMYRAGRYAEALPLITRVLLDDPLDSRFVLMRAHLLVEQGQFRQASPLLDAYSSIDPGDRLYILLRARTALESAKDRNAAVVALKNGLARYPDDPEMMVFAAEVFWNGDEAERALAVGYAERVIGVEPSSVRALGVLLAASLKAADYQAAAGYADRILSITKDFGRYGLLFEAYRGAGRTADAELMAKEWRQRDQSSESAALALARILVDKGDRAAAADLLGTLLSGKGSHTYRSTLFWLQSRIQAGEEAILASLRSALVENGSNVDALAAMTDYYIKKTDYQRARFYLKQAMALDAGRPDIVERREVLAQLGVAIP